MKLPVLLVLLSPVLLAQLVVQGDFVLEGDVRDASTHAPLAGAVVNVNAGQVNALKATTDASGHFRITMSQPVAPGVQTVWSVQVTRAGYLDSAVAMPASGQLPRIELTRQSVIYGKLDDEDGFPVQGARVQAFAYAAGSDLRTQGFPATSDDRGQYRISKLPAGKYYVRADSVPLANWDRRYWPEYFPGTLEPGESGVIDVAEGQERGGVDIHFTKEEGVTLTGSVVLPEGAVPPALLTLNLQSASRPFAPGVFLNRGVQDFAITHVPPGIFTLRVQSSGYPPKAGDLYGEQQVDTRGGGARNMVIPVRVVAPVAVQGSVVLESGPASRVVIGLRGMNGPVKSARTNEDGSFVVNDLLPGHYQVVVSPDISTLNPAKVTPVYVRSVRYGDKEVMREGFDVTDAAPAALRVTVSSAIGVVSGTLLDASGQPVTGGMIALVPTQEGYRERALSAARGSFTLSVPPGEYHVIVAAAPDRNGTLSPEYLKAHANDFPPVRIVEGDKNPPLMLRLPAAR